MELNLLPGRARARRELLRAAVPRNKEVVPCRCGGLAIRVKSTSGELRQFGGASYARTFICRGCSARFVGRAEPIQRAL